MITIGNSTLWAGGPGGGGRELPYMGYIGLVCVAPKGMVIYRFGHK